MGKIGAAIGALLMAAVARAGDAPAVEREYFATRTVQLYYDVVGDAAQAHVELWTTRDGGRTWGSLEGLRTGTASDGRASLTFDLAEDGEYGLKTVAVDDLGNADGRPTPGEAPQLVAVIDTRAPEVHIEAPEPGARAQTETLLTVRWKAEDEDIAEDAVEIDASSDGGGTWNVAAAGLPAQGERLVPLPSEETPDFRVRVAARDRAGNEGSATLARGVVVRKTRPAGSAGQFASETLPPSRSNSLDFEIEFAIDDVGPAGLQTVVLWWTDDSGQTWHSIAREEDHASPFPFHAPQDGSYGFLLQAIDNAHRPSVPDPLPGTHPQRTTLVDATPPEVSLIAPVGGALVGGTTCEVKWSAQDPSFDSDPISLFWSVDGGATWMPVAQGIPNDGTHACTVPDVSSKRVRLKVVAADACGNTAESISEDIVVVGATREPPHARILEVKPRLSGLNKELLHPPLEERPSAQPKEANDTPPAAVSPAQPPHDARAEYDRGRMLRAQGKREDARDAFRAALSADRKYLAAANDLGCVLDEMGDFAGAAEAFAAARDIEPSDPEVRYNLVCALLEVGRPKETLPETRAALAKLSNADRLATGFARLLWRVSLSALEKDDLASAREAWEQIVSVDSPENRWRDSAKEMLERYAE